MPCAGVGSAPHQGRSSLRRTGSSSSSRSAGCRGCSPSGTVRPSAMIPPVDVPTIRSKTVARERGAIRRSRSTSTVAGMIPRIPPPSIASTRKGAATPPPYNDVSANETGGGVEADNAQRRPRPCRNAAGAERGVRNRALIAVLWRCGLRIGEALALKAKDFDPDAGTLVVQRGKGGKRRVVGVDAGTVALVGRRLELHRWRGISGGPLFCALSRLPRGGSRRGSARGVARQPRAREPRL